MPTQSKKASTSANSTGAAKTSKAPSGSERARSVAERAVDLPVGTVLEVSDRVAELFGPFTDRAGAEKQLKTYRTRVRRGVKRTERRGASARRKATTEAKKTRTRVERSARRAFEEQSSRAQGLVDQVTDQLAALR
jgi:uncharacterized protein YfcZ (UPF0381/DUF406 family)